MIDPTQAAGQGQQPTGAPAETTVNAVCIEKQPDGSFMVYEKDDSASQQTMQGGYAAPSTEKEGAQTAPDIDGALELARQMLGSDDADDGTGAQDQAEALFQSGFKGVRTPAGR